MTQRTLEELQNRLRYGDSNNAGHDGVKPQLVLDILDSYVHVDDDGVTELAVLDDVTATAAEINAAADVSGRRVAVADEDTAILAANSGKPHLIANVSADRTFTLPTEADGLEFEFYAQVGAADGHDWIFNTTGNSNYFVGGIIHFDTDADSGNGTIALVAPNGSSNSSLQVNLPQGGTYLKFVCDGTLWTITGYVMSVTVPAFGDQ